MRKSLVSITMIVLSLLFVGFLPRVAKADTITIIPPKFELIGNPGDTVTDKIKVRNDSVGDVSYQISIEDFRAEGDDGSIDLVEQGSAQDNFSLARWITVDQSKFTVPNGKEVVISFTIRIPKSGEPGGHYASILIKRAGVAAPGATSVESRVGSLVLLRVTGATTENASLTSFTTANAFQQYGPMDFHINVKNEGNVHVAPTGTIVITNIFGRKVKEIPVNATTVLPDSTRTIKASWDQRNLIGRYTASLVLTYGQTKQTVSSSTTFIVFPFYLMGVIAGIIILLYFMIAKRKSFKRFINNLTRD